MFVVELHCNILVFDYIDHESYYQKFKAHMVTKRWYLPSCEEKENTFLELGNK